MYTILKKLRKQKMLTQEQVAAALCISDSAYAKIEQGKNRLMDEYYDTLAELFAVPVGTLFTWYRSKGDEEALGGLTVSMNLNEINFGEVLTTEYFYVNMCQGPDFFKFKMTKDAATPFVNKIDKCCKVMSAALKEINDDEDGVANACYEEVDGFVEFCANIISEVEVNGEILDPNETVKELDNIDIDTTKTCKVVCNLVCENYDGVDLIGLTLEEIEWKK